MPSPDDVSFGKIAVEMKYATTAQIEEALEIQRKMALLGVYPKSLAEVLMDRGVLSQYLVRTIYRIQGTREGFPEIPGYEIQSKIGHGGMGTVYRARQLNLDRTVAIKVLDPELAKDRNFVSRFLQEARSVALLNHENIIVGYAAGKTLKEEYYFVMEYVEGDTVYEILKKDRYFEEPRALEITLQMGLALKHAADHNLVHRDIKPDNIMITADGTAKLCDLGLAKSTRGKLRLTQAGSTHGTPHYMSPEQARGREDIDIRSDIYSLGATMYHMLVGEVPFDGESAAVILLKHISEEVPSPRVRRPEITENTCHVLERMMAKKREDRYQSPVELIEDLGRIQSGEAPRSRRLSPGASSIMRIPSDLITAPPPSDSFREEATEAMSRSKLVGKGFLQPMVILTASVFFLILAAGLISAHGRGLKAHEDPEKNKNSGNNETPPAPANGSHTLEEKWARDHFNYAVAYEVDHPEDAPGSLKRYLAVVRKYPGTQGGFEAEEKVSIYVSRFRVESARDLEAAKPKIRSLLEEGDFAGARSRCASILSAYRFIEELGLTEQVAAVGAIHELAREVETEARRHVLSAFDEADALEKGEKITEALALLETVLESGLPDLVARARSRIAQMEETWAQTEEIRRRKGENDARRLYLALLSRVAHELRSRRHETALKACQEALAGGAMEPYRDRCRLLADIASVVEATWRKALDRLEELAGADTEVNLLQRSGDTVRGFVGRKEDDGLLPIFHSSDRQVVRNRIALQDLASLEVLDLAGLGHKGRPFEPAVRRRRGILLLGEGEVDAAVLEFERGGQTEFQGLVEDWSAAASESRAAFAWEEAQAALGADDLERAYGPLLDLESKWKDTLFVETNRARIEEAMTRSRTFLARRRQVSSRFRAAVVALPGGRHAVSYRFDNGLHFADDWEPAGSRDPDREWKTLQEGGILAAGREGRRWRARFTGEVEVSVRFKIEEAGSSVDFLRLEYPDREYLFRLGLAGGAHQILVLRRTREGAEILSPLSASVKGDAGPGTEVHALVRAGPDGIRYVAGGGSGGHIEQPESVTGTGRISLWGTPASVSYLEVRIDCHLDPVWVLGDNR